MQLLFNFILKLNFVLRQLQTDDFQLGLGCCFASQKLFFSVIYPDVDSILSRLESRSIEIISLISDFYFYEYGSDTSQLTDGGSGMYASYGMQVGWISEIWSSNYYFTFCSTYNFTRCIWTRINLVFLHQTALVCTWIMEPRTSIVFIDFYGVLWQILNSKNPLQMWFWKYDLVKQKNASVFWDSFRGKFWRLLWLFLCAGESILEFFIS